MDNNKIVTLKGPERIRKRIEVIFDSRGVDGVINALGRLIDIFATEAGLGYCQGITVTVHKDSSVSVHSMDRGFVIDDTVIDGKPAWHRIFCDFDLAPREPAEDYYYLLGDKYNTLYGQSDTPKSLRLDCDYYFELYCVQCVSALFRVEAVRDGIKKTLCLSRGYSVSDVMSENTTAQSGTLIHFTPDPEIFDNTDIPFEAVDRLLASVRGTKRTLIDKRSGQTKEYL